MNIRIADKKIWLGDESRPFLSGEVHYWRVPPSHWQIILKRVKELGLDFISTYIAWHHHEIAPGQFDFHGKTDPSRDLVRFLDLVHSEGLWLAFRPGPHIYSEWVNGGVPDRVAHLHRLHPDFKHAASEYMAAVVEVARPYFGKPIVLFQADNEPDAWGKFYETQLGLGRTPGFYQEFLRERYEDIYKLNERWETNLTDFSEVRAVTRPFFQGRGYHNRLLDYRRFIYWYTTEIVNWTAQKYRELGVDIPIYTNHYPGFATQHWRALSQTVDFSGPDFYTTNELRRDAIEHQEFLHLMRYPRTYSTLPCIPEFQAGIWHEWHYKTGVISPRHYLLASLSALLAGMAGWNWYMLVNRDNWYMSPINEWGRTRPELFDVFAQIVKLFRAIDPPSLEKLTNTAIVFDQVNRSIELGPTNDLTLRAVYQACIDYECCDLATGSIHKPLMFYSGTRWMSHDQQTRLVEYVENGGHLVFFQHFPTFDETLTPLNLLGIPQPESVLEGGHMRLHLGDQNVSLNAPLFFSYASLEGEPLMVERAYPGDYNAEESKLQSFLPIGEKYIAGYRQQRGKGSLTVLGLPPDPALVLAVHHWLTIPIYSHTRLAQTALFKRDNTFYLVAVNNNDHDQDALVTLHDDLFKGRTRHVRDLLTGKLRETDGTHLVIHLPAKSGTVVEISTEAM